MAERQRRIEMWAYIEHALTSAQVAKRGEIAAIDTATGLLVRGATSATQVPLGYFDENATGDGTTKVRVQLFDEVALHRFDNDSVTPVVAGDILQNCYIKDEQTVTGNATGASVAGTVFGVSSAGVLVKMAGF